MNGTRLYYEIAGSGPPLVLVHAITLDARMWDEQFEVFAERYRVLRYDVRGFGRSNLPAGGPYSHAEDLRALLTFLDVDHASLVGLSMGGGIAIEFALAHPSASDALILVDATVAGYQWVEGLPTGARDQAAEAGISAAKLTWLQRPIFAPAYEHPEVARRLAEMVETYSGWHWINDNPVRGAQPPAIQQLETLRVPTLVIIGERDVLDFQRIAEILAKRIPGAVKVVMLGVGHMANMEDPERFNALVLDFLAKR